MKFTSGLSPKIDLFHAIQRNPNSDNRANENSILKFFEDQILTGTNQRTYDPKVYERRINRLAKVAGSDCALSLSKAMSWAGKMMAEFNRVFAVQIQEALNPQNNNFQGAKKEFQDFIKTLSGTSSVIMKARLIADFLTDKGASQQGERGLQTWFQGAYQGVNFDFSKLIKCAEGKKKYKTIENDLIQKAQAANHAQIRDNVMKILTTMGIMAISIVMIVLAPAIGTSLWIVLMAASIGLGFFILLYNTLTGKYSSILKLFNSCALSH